MFLEVGKVSKIFLKVQQYAKYVYKGRGGNIDTKMQHF